MTALKSNLMGLFFLIDSVSNLLYVFIFFICFICFPASRLACTVTENSMITLVQSTKSAFIMKKEPNVFGPTSSSLDLKTCLSNSLNDSLFYVVFVWNIIKQDIHSQEVNMNFDL